MTPVYLRHRALVSDPWTEPPTLALLYPNTPAGAVPAAKVTIELAPEEETPCGCAGASTTQDHLAMKVTMPPIPVGSSAAFVNFLLNFNQAALRESKSARYGAGTHKTTLISNIKSQEIAGDAIISFRLAVPIASAIAP